MSPNLRGQDNTNLETYNGKFTTAGMIIGLQSGFISTKQFYIGSGGNAYFKGNLQASSGSIGGWDIDENKLIKWNGEGVGEFSPERLRLVKPSWKRTLLEAGKIVINTQNDSNCGIYVTNSGVNTDDVGGTHVQITGTGIRKEWDGGSGADVAWDYDLSALKTWAEETFQPKGEGGDYVKLSTSYHYGTYTDEQGTKWISISKP